MLTRTSYRVLAVAALGLAGSFNGCSCEGQVGTPPKMAEPPPPPPPPAVPPPAPPPEPTPPPPPVVDHEVSKLKTVGKAKIEGDQIKIPGKLEFDFDKATIRNDAGSTEILTTLTDVLKQNPSVGKVRIEGHTDNVGGPEHNKNLSRDRAAAVAKWLETKGIDSKRVEVVGMGEERPLVPNTSDANKQINRRTEFHILEIDGKPVPQIANVGGNAAAAAVTGIKGAADGGAAPVIPGAATAPTKPKPGETVMRKGGGK